MVRHLPWWLLVLCLVVGLGAGRAASAGRYKAARTAPRSFSKAPKHRGPYRIQGKLERQVQRSKTAEHRRFHNKTQPPADAKPAPQPDQATTTVAKSKPRIKSSSRVRKSLNRKARKLRAKARKLRARARKRVRKNVKQLRKIARKQKRILRKRLSRLFAVAQDTIGTGLTYVGAYMTLGTDVVERALPGKWRGRLRTLRYFSPPMIASFIVERARRDPLFMVSYVSGSYALSQAIVAGLVVAGVNIVVAYPFSWLVLPIDITVLLLREKHLRRKTEPNLTFEEAGNAILKDYLRHAAKRRGMGRQLLGRKAIPSYGGIGAL